MKDSFVFNLVHMLQSIGPVSSRRMFGGYGIFLDGLMFGLVADGILYLKVDAHNINDYKTEGMEAFSYHKKGKEFKMSYYQVPLEVVEDVDEILSWAKSAHAAALRGAAKKAPR